MNDAITGVGKEWITASNMLGEYYTAVLVHQGHQEGRIVVRVDISEPHLKQGICRGPAIDSAAAGGPPGHTVLQLGRGGVVGGVGGQGDQQQLLNLQHVEGQHLHPWNLEILE
jgi:hypothetical protein